MVESHASLFGLKFWTFNFGDNRPTLEPVFRVEGRSTTILYFECTNALVLTMVLVLTNLEVGVSGHFSPFGTCLVKV